jgi:hypothetical protein
VQYSRALEECARADCGARYAGRDGDIALRRPRRNLDEAILETINVK